MSSATFDPKFYAESSSKSRRSIKVLEVVGVVKEVVVVVAVVVVVSYPPPRVVRGEQERPRCQGHLHSRHKQAGKLSDCYHDLIYVGFSNYC